MPGPLALMTLETMTTLLSLRADPVELLIAQPISTPTNSMFLIEQNFLYGERHTSKTSVYTYTKKTAWHGLTNQ
ncbi:hypothetical protein EG329_003882 [Mollisiaceae sp. DMI_Dod_QoI]|nr:hypothetical protein EG329_003882 [Helotiales sp. DMI_Dod_QoI]